MKFDLHNNKDFLAGLLFIVLGVLALFFARDYAVGSAMRMGPGYFPMVLAGILLLIGLAVMVRGIRSGAKVNGGWSLRPLAFITLSIVAFGFLMDRLGLVPALVALFFAAALGGPEFRFREVALLTVVMSLAAVGVFVYGLKLPYQLFIGF